MNLDGLKIKPSEGMLAVRFLDEEKAEDAQPAQPASTYPTDVPTPDTALCLAVVIAAGKKVEAKPDQLVAVAHYARKYADKIGDDVFLVNQWDVKAIVITAK